MRIKHTRRIKGYEEAFRPVWHFFDLRSYIIMAFMMGGGIWLRSSGLVPDVFVAVFYTGLGCALSLAGVLFWIMFFRFREDHHETTDIGTDAGDSFTCCDVSLSCGAKNTNLFGNT